MARDCLRIIGNRRSHCPCSLRPLACWDCGFEIRQVHRKNFVSREFCTSSGKGLCIGLITPPEESYRVCCIQGKAIAKPRECGHDPESVRRAKGFQKKVGNQTVKKIAVSKHQSLYPNVSGYPCTVHLIS
jgi:hypothetical protein